MQRRSALAKVSCGEAAPRRSPPLLVQVQGEGWGEVRWSLYESRSKWLRHSKIQTDLSRRSRCSLRPLPGQGEAMKPWHLVMRNIIRREGPWVRFPPKLARAVHLRAK